MSPARRLLGYALKYRLQFDPAGTRPRPWTALRRQRLDPLKVANGPVMPNSSVFEDRRAAGRVLGAFLQKYAGRTDVVVLALPRGGVPVAVEVAASLRAPLDVFLVRKLGTPGHQELAMGAIASGGIRVVNDDVIRWFGIAPATIEAVAREEQRELERRERAYRGERAPLELDGRTVILVDDGLATGSTMRAAVQAVRQRSPSRTIVAVPVGARSTCDDLASAADEVVCARMPEPFSAVGQWYADFSQTSDEEVCALLREHPTSPQPRQ